MKGIFVEHITKTQFSVIEYERNIYLVFFCALSFFSFFDLSSTNSSFCGLLYFFLSFRQRDWKNFLTGSKAAEPASPFPAKK